MTRSASESSTPKGDSFTAVALAVGLAALVARALPALGQAFWIDEAGTWWLIDGGWSELVARWRAWPYQSLAHSGVTLAARQLLGPGEWALRLPTVLAAAASLVLWHRLARRLIGPVGAAATLLALFGSPAFYFALTMARPYALGLLALTVSWTALVAWAEDGATWRLALWAAASAAVGYFHFTLALGLLAQLPFVAMAWSNADAQRRRRFALAAAAALLACLPLAGSLRATAAGLPALRMYRDVGGGEHALVVLTPTVLGFQLLVVVAAAIAHGAWPVFGARPASRRAFLVLAPLWLIPTLVTSLAHSLHLAALNLDRYQMAGQLGLALAVGLTVDRLEPARARRTAIALLVFLAPFTAVTRYWPLYDGCDWRAAARASPQLAAPDDLVLVPSKFIESSHPAHFAELENVGKLSALLVAYPIAGRVVPLPRDVLPETTEFAARRLRAALLDERQRFVLLHVNSGDWLQWLQREHPEFRLLRRYHWGRLDWLVFERRAPPAPAGG